jgi:hypothetical protein
MIEVVCVCKRSFEVQDDHAGLSIKCPDCRRLVSVPAQDPGPVADTIPPPGLVVSSDATRGPEAAGPAPRGEDLLPALESMLRLGRTIRALLACILAVLVLMLLRASLRP